MTSQDSPRARFLASLRGEGPTPSLQLTELARKYGVTTDYTNWRGEPKRVSALTIKAVLGALGVPADTPGQVQASLDCADDLAWSQLVPPTTVVRAGASFSLPLHLPQGAKTVIYVTFDDDPAFGGGRPPLSYEVVADGAASREVAGAPVVRVDLELPGDLPLGWHRIAVEAVVDRLESRSEGALVVCPDHLELPATLQEHAVWGPMVQLYSVRSHQSWGTGDFADLGQLGAAMAKANGADFVLINPIHAAQPVAPFEPSPYLPATRDFTNPYYIRPQDIPEYAAAPAPVKARVEALAAQAQAGNDDAQAQIDRDKLWPLKREALELIFTLPRAAARQSELDAYHAGLAPAIDDFALWCALMDHDLGLAVEHGSPEAAAFAEQHAAEVEFHVWLQWIADQQLAAAQQACLDGGMAIGIIKDLAVGVHPEGADAWSRKDLLATTIQVGAPPDYFNQVGQGWSEPPWRPDALEATGYAPYRAMLRAVLAHAGALRIDHILGLFRLWWIPQHASPGDGTYVAYNHEAMASILVLEATRAGAVVVGEDLGVMAPGVRQYLASRGLLGNSIVWFEKDDDDYHQLPPERFRRLSLTAITTHDLPPTSAYLAGEHITQRNELGMLDQPLEQAMAAARAERGIMIDILTERGFLDPALAGDDNEIMLAMHRFLLATPALLLGVSLADMAGERRTQNLPGTDREYPNWSVPLADASGRAQFLEDLPDNPTFQRVAAVMQGNG
ncbi:MAG: 4-alpha-glucanotransferase [Bifidobacteriaceae bacterium]|jgi:4-alpha-glucanotransferase|nr:4-alpha-glucanotransferase [Bifidobacteriaceae bacterium]